jgi:predicted deacylase
VDYSKNAGDRFEKGDELAVVRTMDGQVVERIHAEMAGWLAGWFEGVAKYPGAALGMVLTLMPLDKHVHSLMTRVWR